MSLDVEWNGLPLVRTQEFTIEVPFAAEAMAHWRLPHDDAGERTVRVQLAPGQTWAQAGPRLRKGQAVDFTMTGVTGIPYRFVGRVKYRRLGRLVVVGRIVSKR